MTEMGASFVAGREPDPFVLDYRTMAQDEIDDVLDRIPPEYEGLFQAARSGNDPRKAIAAACIHCTGFDPESVRDCPMTKCALHPYRNG